MIPTMKFIGKAGLAFGLVLSFSLNQAQAQKLQVCLNQATGVISAKKKCGSSLVRLDLSSISAQGAAGQVGPQGDVGPVGPVGPQGPQGIAGAAGLDGAQGPVGPQGDVGPQGVQGIQGVAGATGPQGDVGPVGPQGPAGIASTDLPVGATLRGTFFASGVAVGANNIFADSIPFGFVLPAAPTVRIVNLAAGATLTAECPQAVPTPEAAPGYLCLYSTFAINNQSFGVTSTNGGVGTATTFGTSVFVQSSVAGTTWFAGNWAVTAQ